MPTDETLQLVSVTTMAADADCHPRTIKRRARLDPSFPKLVLYGKELRASKDAWESYKRALLVGKVSAV